MVTLMVIAYVCPAHGTVVEFDSPGPKEPPTHCFRVVARERAVLCGPNLCRLELRREERP